MISFSDFEEDFKEEEEPVDDDEDWEQYDDVD